jgi:hypothetical protein
MRRLAIHVAFCVVFAVYAHGAQRPAVTQVVPTYELYSWKTPEGLWAFRLMYTTDRQKTPEEVLGEKTALLGMEQLKKTMSKLPKGSRVVWFDRLTLNGVKIKGSEPLTYPPRDVIDEVRRYADSHSIQLSGTPEQ